LTRAQAAIEFAGRALIAGLFVAGAVQKLIDPSGAVALLVLAGLPGWLVWPALVFSGLAGLGLLAGIAARPLGLALAAYCIATSYFHYLMGDAWQMTIVAKNWTIAGGCLLLAAHGAGPWRLGRGRLP